MGVGAWVHGFILGVGSGVVGDEGGDAVGITIWVGVGVAGRAGEEVPVDGVGPGESAEVDG